jgi:C-terminal peptidase prc
MIYRTLVILTLLLCLSLGPAVAQKRKAIRPTTIYRGSIAKVVVEGPEAKLSPEAKRRHTAFLEVWSTIEESYFDPKFGNLDWQKIRTEFEPKVIAAKNDTELYALLRQMVGRLQVSHLSIIPPEVFDAIEDAKAEAKAREAIRAENLKKDGQSEGETKDEMTEFDPTVPYGLGIDLALLEDKFVITRVGKDSAAERAGLKLGHAIESINGVSLLDMLARITQFYGSEQMAFVRHHVPAEIIESFINGEEDTFVDVKFSDGTGATKEARIPREPLRRDRTVVIAPNFPDRTLSFESSSLDPKTGYIRFNHFASALIPKFCTAVGEHVGKEALIIDLRGNSGGLLASLGVLMGMLTDKPTPIGTMQYRRSELPLTADPKAKNFKGRIVLLIDARTASAGEIFTQALRESGRALVVGEKSSGEALPSIAVRLTTGATFLFPIANFKSGNGRHIEGSGIIPDQVVPWDRKSLLAGNDSQLDIARQLVADTARFTALTAKTAMPMPPSLSGPIPSGSGKVQPPPPGTKFTIKGDSAAPPPPPPPKRVQQPTADQRVLPPGHDATAKRVLNDFYAAIGGKDALKAVTKYKMHGSTRMAISGIDLDYDVASYAEFPDKYAEHFVSETTGEIRQVSVGNKFLVQTSLGGNVEVPMPIETKDVDPLAGLFALGDAEKAYPSLSYTGEYMRDGRKTIVLEGRLPKGSIVAFAFDVETKLLVNISAELRSVSFGDYKSAGTLRLPFVIERGGSRTAVTEYGLNTTIDPAEFQKKMFCFDSPN